MSQAVCELHLGRTEEAQAALEQALQKDASYAEAIANMLVLTVVTGNDPAALTEYVFASSLESAHNINKLQVSQEGRPRASVLGGLGGEERPFRQGRDEVQCQGFGLMIDCLWRDGTIIMNGAKLLEFGNIIEQELTLISQLFELFDL